MQIVIQLISDLAIKLIRDPIIEKFRLNIIHTNQHIKNNHIIWKGLRYDICNNEIKKGK